MATKEKTQTPSQAVLDKIAKLLARTVENGCTEAEAATAAGMVQRLLLEHGLSMSEALSHADAKDQEEDKVGPRHVRADWKHQGQYEWQLRLARQVAKVTCCAHLISKGVGKQPDFYIFVGTSTNVTVAEQLFQWLSDQMFRLGLVARQEAYDLRGKTVEGFTYSQYIGKNWLRSYMLGITTRVSKRLDEQFTSQVDEFNAQGYVLVKTDDAKRVADTMATGKFNKKSSAELNENGLEKGWKDGDKVKLANDKSLVDLGPKALEGN